MGRLGKDCGEGSQETEKKIRKVSKAKSKKSQRRPTTIEIPTSFSPLTMHIGFSVVTDR
jgi:hypothetical protein